MITNLSQLYDIESVLKEKDHLFFAE